MVLRWPKSTEAGGSALTWTDAPAIEADAIQRTIDRALDGAASGALAKAEAARLIWAAFEGQHPSTTPAQRVAAESARYLAEYDELGGDGDRLAAGKVANAHCGGDPQQREIIAQRIRRLARRRKASTARFAG